ncbi:L,D-transpeptidase family protein [Rubritalea tangerina]|uniref:L,D-transpeptidase family protein n=1 Tax=Rubritalea tangerina TaxID=430798 RepID=A0ABW4ZDM9_9BACT
MISRILLICIAGLLPLFNSCTQTLDVNQSKMLVSVKDQKMLLTQHGKPIKSYKISTSKFGLGDTPRSMRTPLGTMQVAKKIGHGQPKGAVFKSRRPTGEVLPPNAPGRDPIVTRIMWLKGTERRNKNAFERYIYIHGTPEERRIGQKASYGCIRMTSSDIVDLYSRIGVNAEVKVIKGSLEDSSQGRKYARMSRIEEKQAAEGADKNA